METIDLEFIGWIIIFRISFSVKFIFMKDKFKIYRVIVERVI